jgi:hypothetical protein
MCFTLGKSAAHMTSKIQEAIRGCQQDVIVAAEQKLGRALTHPERLGIESITSLMMLDSCCQSFRLPGVY